MTDTTATAAFLDRYKAREQFTGEDGSIFKVRGLRPAEIFHVRDMLSGCDETTFNVMTAVASVCWSDRDMRGKPVSVDISFPQSRGALDAMINRIGLDGIKGLTRAFNKVNGGKQPEGEDEDVADAA